MITLGVHYATRSRSVAGQCYRFTCMVGHAPSTTPESTPACFLVDSHLGNCGSGMGLSPLNFLVAKQTPPWNPRAPVSLPSAGCEALPRCTLAVRAFRLKT